MYYWDGCTAFLPSTRLIWCPLVESSTVLVNHRKVPPIFIAVANFTMFWAASVLNTGYVLYTKWAAVRNPRTGRPWAIGKFLRYPRQTVSKSSERHFAPRSEQRSLYPGDPAFHPCLPAFHLPFSRNPCASQACRQLVRESGPQL
jgi:hypothetical protein